MDCRHRSILAHLLGYATAAIAMIEKTGHNFRLRVIPTNSSMARATETMTKLVRDWVAKMVASNTNIPRCTAMWCVTVNVPPSQNLLRYTYIHGSSARYSRLP